MNDDELCKWLGVSRTPVREAIAQLHSYGLVEIEANRYTRVAALDDALYAEAAQFLAGIHSLGRQWGLGKLSASEKKQLVKELRTLHSAIGKQDLDAPKHFLDVQGAFVRASGNALMVETEEQLRTRVKFLSPRDAERYDWNALDQAVLEITAQIEGSSGAQ